MINRIARSLLGLIAFTGLTSLVWSADSVLSELETQGKYLAAAGNCVSCHTTEGGDEFAGGLAFETTFGTLYSTNITPDVETGIGAWSLADFERAMRKGERPNGEHLYPAFPYTSYTLVSDEDIAAIFAYLKTLQPIPAAPKENDLGFPYNQRWALGLWKSLFFEEKRFQTQPSQSAESNRGAYLIQGLGHCGECHSPRNFLGATDTTLAMTGSTYLERVEGKLSAWSAPNLTSASTGLAQWSEQDIAEYLGSGYSHRAGVFGPMNKVIVNGTSQLTDEDLSAMAEHLKGLPALAITGNSPASDDVLRAGSLQYDIHCGTCHLPTGEGSTETGPPLISSPVVLDNDPASLINITLFGAQLPQTAPSTAWQARGWKRMEPYANKLNDEQIAALLSYMRGTWGHTAGEVTAQQVGEQR